MSILSNSIFKLSNDLTNEYNITKCFQHSALLGSVILIIFKSKVIHVGHSFHLIQKFETGLKIKTYYNQPNLTQQRDGKVLLLILTINYPPIRTKYRTTKSMCNIAFCNNQPIDF